MYRSDQIKNILHLMGSFVFAFLLGEMVHEWGHFLAHRYYGHQGISIHLDPFGGSRNLGVGPMPLHELGITTAAGPGFNLVAGILMTALFFKFKSPGFLPLILWGPIALIQEGVNLSLGLLSRGSDAQWLVQWGISKVALIFLGVFFILAGTGLISWILHRIGRIREMRFGGRLTLVFFGLGFLMILRALLSSFQSPEATLENLIPLLFALILAVTIAGPLNTWRVIEERVPDSTQTPTRESCVLALGLGFGMLFLQIILP
jgi:hypothetical protein